MSPRSCHRLKVKTRSIPSSSGTTSINATEPTTTILNMLLTSSTTDLSENRRFTPLKIEIFSSFGFICSVAMIRPFWTRPAASAAAIRIRKVGRRIPTTPKASWPNNAEIASTPNSISCGAAINRSRNRRNSFINAGAVVMIMMVPARIMNQWLTSRELATWPLLRASWSRLWVGSSVFCDWSSVCSATTYLRPVIPP